MRTGRFRFRNGWRGAQVLEVEIRYPDGPMSSFFKVEWIKATTADAVTIMQRLNCTLGQRTTQ